SPSPLAAASPPRAAGFGDVEGVGRGGRLGDSTGRSSPPGELPGRGGGRLERCARGSAAGGDERRTNDATSPGAGSEGSRSRGAEAAGAGASAASSGSFSPSAWFMGTSGVIDRNAPLPARGTTLPLDRAASRPSSPDGRSLSRLRARDGRGSPGGSLRGAPRVEGSSRR